MAEPETSGIEAMSRKLDVLLNVLLHFARKEADFNGGKRETGDLAVWLNKLGMSHAEIATMLGSTTNSVGVMLHKKRKASKKSKKK
jgi:hypothetical protein